MSDYYNVLRVGHNASRKEIDKAYQRLVKEAHYDTTIDVAAVETAYRVLSDIPTKAQYDTRQTQKTKKIERQPKVNRTRFQAFLDWLTLPHLLRVLGISVLLLIAFYWFRFGYMLQEFQAGDILFDKASKGRYGRIIKVESNHRFGDATEDGYQIQLDASQIIIGTSERLVWFPQDAIKAQCYKP